MIVGPTAPSEGIFANFLLTIIIPTIIIIFMLVMAMLLACVLYKKRMAGKVNLFYSESLPPRAPVLLKDELYDESCHYITTNGNGTQTKQGLVPDDYCNNPNQCNSADQLHWNPEVESFLHMHKAPVRIDPFVRGSLSRPSPIYQKRQM